MRRLTCLSAALLTALALSALAARAQSIAELGARGDALSAEGKFDEAISIYRQAIARAPDDSRLHLGLIRTLLQKR